MPAPSATNVERLKSLIACAEKTQRDAVAALGDREDYGDDRFYVGPFTLTDARSILADLEALAAVAEAAKDFRLWLGDVLRNVPMHDAGYEIAIADVSMEFDERVAALARLPQQEQTHA